MSRRMHQRLRAQRQHLTAGQCARRSARLGHLRLQLRQIVRAGMQFEIGQQLALGFVELARIWVAVELHPQPRRRSPQRDRARPPRSLLGQCTTATPETPASPLRLSKKDKGGK